MLQAKSNLTATALNDVSQSDMAGLQARLRVLADQLDGYVQKYEFRKDSRAIFTFAYVILTRTLAQKLPQTEFGDPGWVVGLAENFGARYVAALETSVQQPSQVPAAWQVVFDAVHRKRTSVLEDLIFGMTAHIVHDLPLSLTEVGMSDSQGRSRIYDFHRMNDVLAVDIQPIANGVTDRYEPFFRWLDQLEQTQTLILTNFGFRLSRGVAWYNANRLLDPKSAELAHTAITRSVATLVETIQNPPFWSLRIVFRMLRFVATLFRRWPRPSA